tara:strand:+ start:185 stop:1036 length:852 start_codon:yes stop_codon:yes gene_type:complete
MKKLIIFFIRLIGSFKVTYKISKIIVSAYDNDCNTDIYTNGELNLIKFLAHSNLFSNKKSLSSTQKDYIFDVGANVGEYSKILQQHLVEIDSDKKMIFSFEPSMDNINKIRKLKLKNVSLINCAVSDKNGSTSFFKSKNRNNSAGDSLFDMNAIGYSANTKKRIIKTVTLDNFCSKRKINHIKFLKMDIEGGEFHALLGSRSLLKNGAIDIIQFEYGHAARAARVSLFDIIQLLEKYKYYTYVIKPKKIERISYTPFTDNQYNMANFVSFKKTLLPIMNKIIA